MEGHALSILYWSFVAALVGCGVFFTLTSITLLMSRQQEHKTKPLMIIRFFSNMTEVQSGSFVVYICPESADLHVILVALLWHV